MNNLHQFVSYFDFFIIEDAILHEASGWTIQRTKAYKKGEKKYRNDKRVIAGVKAIVKFVTSQSQQPRITDYPPEFNVHAISVDKRFGEGVLWSHLKGQKIGLLFKPDYENDTITMIHLGTHQDLGWR